MKNGVTLVEPVFGFSVHAPLVDILVYSYDGCFSVHSVKFCCLSGANAMVVHNVKPTQ